jgi:hypothetical protein
VPHHLTPPFFFALKRKCEMKNIWSLTNVPPKGDDDVAEFANRLYEAAKAEKERLGKPKDFMNNYALYRGRQTREQTGRKGYSPAKKVMTPINLYFANVERTVGNITARNPVGEVVDLDGIDDGTEKILSMVLKKWWKETDQLPKTRHTARLMEIYGITGERPLWDKQKDRPDIDITDPFCVFPAPGYYEKIDEEAPYICFAYVDFVSKIESLYGVKNVAPEAAYDLTGREREEYKAEGYGVNQSIGNYAGPMTVKKTETPEDKTLERCLVIEVWLRDSGAVRTETPIINAATNGQALDPITQEPLFEQRDMPVYRDGIRKITFTRTTDAGMKSGFAVLDDSPNPNLNPALPDELAGNTHPWGRLPFYYANSYKDGVSIWGFSAAEQVGDLINKINLIFSKLIAYVINVMTPPLIVQKNCGITREMIESSIQNAGRLILMPTVPHARIEFMQIPNLPQTFFEVLNLIVRFFDRIYQIEEADRGVAPGGVIAAQAIVALQERNAVLMQAKTSAIDFLAQQRSRWAIGLYQNFGTKPDSVKVDDTPVEFYGVKFAGGKYNYVIESGSTMPRTSLQTQELAFKLYEEKAIGQKGLLEALNWPNWREELERTAESQVDQALRILIDAGLPEEQAAELKQFVMVPGQTKKAGGK